MLSNKDTKLILSSFIITTLVSIVVVVYLSKINNKPHKNNQTLKFYNNNKFGEIEGATTKKTLISADFSHQISIGSSQIFGGSHSPRIAHQAAWDSIEKVGVTSIRRDLYIENELPKNITLDDYKNNINGIQEPNKWNKEAIEQSESIFLNAKKRGLSVVGILSYAPAWLTYSNTSTGVPRDWDIYKDIIKKLYKIHRNNIDYIEIWNEPNSSLFIDTTNTDMSREEAYKNIFKYATATLREVDQEINDGKKILIGGPVISNPDDTLFFESFINDPAIRSNLDFVSFHTYGNADADWSKYKNILKKYNLEDKKIIISEWAHKAKYNKLTPYVDSNEGILFTSSQLINFLKNGIYGANYFSTTYNDLSKPDTVFSAFGFYRITGDSVILLPQAKSWSLLSSVLGLGQGDSKIYKSDVTNMKMLPFINNKSEYGLVMVNDSIINLDGQIILKGITHQNLSVRKYTASNTTDPNIMDCETNMTAENNALQFSTTIPAKSVVGILIINNSISIDNFTSILSTQTSKTLCK